MVSVSRRAILGLMFTGLAVAGGGFLFANGPESLIRKILARRFPDQRISQAGIASLKRDLIAARFDSLGRRTALEGVARAAGIVGIDALAGWKITAAQFNHLERQIVTYFILGSDVMDVLDRKRNFVTYTETPEVCLNRFAEYDA